MRTVDEQRLWATWRETRDETAFEQLVQPHLPFAIDLARRLGCDAHDADDLAQESLAALAATRNDRPTEVGLRAWIGRRVSLGAKTLRRSRRRRAAHEGCVPPPSAATAVAEIDSRDSVDAALARLAPDERQAIVLRFLHDLEYREVAYVLGISPLAARLRVHRSLAKLRARLGRNASALVATGVLWTGSKSAHALVGGVLLMSKSIKITAAGIVILVVALLSVQALTPERGEARRTTDTRVVLPGAEAPEEAQPDQPAIEVPNLDAAKSALESVRRGTWSDYDSTRAAAQLSQQTKKLYERMQAIAPDKKTKPEPLPDSTSRLYIEKLIARYKSMEEGLPRIDVLINTLSAHRRYIDQTHDLAFLPFFDGLLANGSEREQTTVAGAIGGLRFSAVIDLLLRAARHEAAPVRAQAVGSLAEVRGHDAPRAHRAVVDALDDTDANVRWSAALALEYTCGAPQHLPALLDQIGREQQPVAMHAMISAVRTLDPQHGEHRIDDALAAAPAPVQSAGQKAKTHEPDATPFHAPTAAGRPASPAPQKTDPETRAYLEQLGEELLAMPEGDAREQKLRIFTTAHADYLRRTKAADLLPLIRRLIDRSSDVEQRSLMNSLGRTSIKAILDQLVAWTTHTDPTVRAAAAHGLIIVKGNEQDRARKAAIALLEDSAVAVRREVAMSLLLAGDPALADVLIERLAHEPDFTVIYSMVLSAKSMDPKSLDRIEAATEPMQAEQAVLVRRALQSARR